MAARKHFPAVKIQTCYNHFKENIRRELNVRSDPTYRYISVAIDNILSHRQPMWMFNERFQRLYDKYSSNPVAQQVLTNVQKNKTELLAYKWIRKSPYTNNGKFRYLRGKTGVQMIKKERVNLPLYF